VVSIAPGILICRPFGVATGPKVRLSARVGLPGRRNAMPGRLNGDVLGNGKRESLRAVRGGRGAR